MGVLSPGASLADRYVVQELLGAGSNTEVYRAEDRREDRVVAIKLLIGDLLYERSPERFRREATAMAKLEHDGVVRIFDAGQTGPLGAERSDGLPYIVMEYVGGGTLRERLAEPLAFDEVVALGQRLAAVLGVVHEHGLIHGDVKPDNIYLPDGDVRRAKLGDFGLVDRVVSTTGRTEAGVVLGTPLYMSPEQVRGEGRSPASDVWMLGVVLFECSYGKLPFERGSLPGLLSEIITKDPVFEPLDHELDRVLARALAKAPADRFASMRDFAAAIGAENEARFEPVAGLEVRPLDRTPDVKALGPTHEAATSARVVEDLGPLDTAVPSASSARSAIWRLVITLVLIVGLVVVVTLASNWLGARWFVSALLSAVLAAVLMYGLLSGLERRGERRASTLSDDTEQLRRRANLSEVISRSIALTMETVLAGSAADPSIDLRRVSLALAIDDFELAKDRADQRQALDRAIEIADKLREQMQQRVRPWYVRHKEALTMATAVLAAAAALVSSIGGVLG